MTYYYWEWEIIRNERKHTQVIAVKANSREEARELFIKRAGHSIKELMSGLIKQECVELSEGMKSICDMLLNRYPIDCTNGKAGRFYRFTPSLAILIITTNTQPKVEPVDVGSFFD